ncbi:sorting nexin-8 [Geosmithia morbida]|uniref:Sorting nexin MVP1 n=1 Tax=Geosmithia morbida TaxID=1094350 RepID=A0A9P5D0U7_9HYPO|nr:sorting nexin-8 [Geosmithia morbida]KAF4119806.1 sorting nexin-8 [Geosmithia morbida]
MSLFGTSPTERDEVPSVASPGRTRSGRGGLFDETETPQRAPSTSLFADNIDSGDGDDALWAMPSPRKQQTKADVVRNLLPSSDVPGSYIESFDAVLNRGSGGHVITSDDISQVFAAARLSDVSVQSRIVNLVAPDGGSQVQLGRGEFNVLMALVGLAQEGEEISLDGVDERRKNLPQPKLFGLNAEPIIPPVEELASKPPQTPIKDTPLSRSQHRRTPPNSQTRVVRPTMDDPEDDPWNSPEVHKNHDHSSINGTGNDAVSSQISFGSDAQSPLVGARTTSQHTVSESHAPSNGAEQQQQMSHTTDGGHAPAQGDAWGGYYDGAGSNTASFNPTPVPGSDTNPFGAGGALGGDLTGRPPRRNPLAPLPNPVLRGNGVSENILVTLMPDKEGLFMFQHHNYEVTSQRRGSKVVRRYSDFVWLLDCLHKRYPFRIIPLLPPKRVAVNGNHLSNDGSFIEKRRRGLVRFLNALARHPVLGQEQLVVMFLTVPTELAVWRKQASISVLDEFSERALVPGLEESLPATLEDLFARTRVGIKRSAELYINICSIMDRLVKRQEGIAADHGRIATLLGSLTGTSADTYATDTNEIPLLNDGLGAMSKHLRTCQALVEDESRGWDEGVLEDLKQQRDALVSAREMFDRRERLDKDSIPYLERRIQTNESKLANLRSKPEGTIKAGEIERVAESIIKDKESIVQQHNRSVFVKECLRDELISFQSTQYHVSRWNQEWASERVKYAEMLADNWRQLIDELEGMPLGD